MTHRKVALLLAIAVMAVSLFFLPSPIQAQAVYGSILGTVTDPNGAAVPNAKVTVTNVRKGTTEVTTTNGDGNYSVTHLIPNVYTVKVEAPNFKATQTDNVVVNADSSSRVDLPLQLGQVSESVEVTVEAPQLKTDRADVSTTFDTKTVEDLPIINRNFTSFLLLTPGAQILSGWSHAATENPQGSKQTFVNGQHFSGTGYELDGTDNQDPILGIIVINPNLDAVTEAKITTADYDAEFGKAIAGIVAAQTKSGSNGFHGSIFEYRRTDALQAKDPFQKPDPVTNKIVPPDKWNQFGASIGGPIKKDKIFFFGDYQGTREIFGQAQQVTVPTNLVRTTCLAATGFCDLSQYLGAQDLKNPNAPRQGQIFDPATGNPDGSGRTPFVGNLIPVSRLSPQALKILSALPAASSGQTTNNFSAVGSGPYNQDGFDSRIDYAVRSNMNLFGRYSMQKFNLSGQGVFGALGGPGFGPQGLAGSSNASNHSIATGFTYTLSPTLLTDFRFGFFRYHVNAQKFDAGTTPASDFGIPGLNTSTLTSGLPGFFIDSTGDNDQGIKIGEALNIGRCNCPLNEAEHQQQYVTNWTKVRGNHQIKFGADIRFANNLRVPSDANRAGQLNFRQNGTSLAGAGGLGLATFLLGQVSDMSRYVNNPNALAPHENQRRFFFYGQDIFRVTQKLTVNYGLRWEYYSPESVDCKGCGGFGHISTGQVLVAGFGNVNQSGNVDPTYHAFAPRLGIAYQATEKTVVRMGYGRSFDIGVFGSIFGHTVTQNLPVLVNQSVTAQNNGNPNATNEVVGAFNLATGPPAAVFPTIPASGILPLQGVCTPVAPATTCNGNFNSKTRPDQMRLPTLDAWNLTIQRQITPTMSGEIAYVGNKGTHVFIGNGPSYNLNTPTIVGFNDKTISQASRRPFTNRFTYADFPGVVCCSGDIDWRGDEASSNYNALQLRLDKRFSHGLSFQSHYTWSKAFGYGFGDNADYFAVSPKVVYGRVDFNRDHVFLVNGLYELPFGKGKAFANAGHGVVEALVGGWQISTIASVFSGLPFTPSYNECNADRDTGPCRPSKANGSFDMGLGRFDPVNHVIQYFTPVNPLTTNGETAGIFQRPQSGTFGTYGPNSLTGPGNWTLDGGLIKRIPIGERVRGQFRMDVFNLFNHVVPGFSQNQGNRCIDCAGPNSNAGQATSLEFGRTMRNAQFALRFEF